MNVIGWSQAPTGVGEACRGTLAALAAAGIERALWPLDDLARGARGQGLPYEVSLYHVNADMMATVDRRLPRSFTPGGTGSATGSGSWRTSPSPSPTPSATSTRCGPRAASASNAFQSLAPGRGALGPALRGAHGGGARRPRGARDRRREASSSSSPSTPSRVPERKNPEGLLAAFALAARESRRPLHLLLKVNHAESEAAFVERLRQPVRGPARHPADRHPEPRPARRPDRRLRRLRLAPPLRGARPAADRGDVPRQAGDRDRLRRRHRLPG